MVAEETPRSFASWSQTPVSDSPRAASPDGTQPPVAAAPVHREGKIRPWPWWAPRFWHGMPLSVWLQLANEYRWRASPSRWGLVATITAAAGFNSLAARVCEGAYSRKLRSPPVTPPPLFIIGHWRSGTTLLHELFMHDKRFCCPNYYQCYSPSHFLLTERVLTPALSWIIPAKRPMDDMAVSLDKPQEDEFALMNLGAPSPYRRMAFPLEAPRRPEALDVSLLPPRELARWQAAVRRFLTALAVRDDRRPVLKSPPHTARMGVLRAMYPGAKFLHIVRDPYVVFPSTVRLWQSMNATQGLQVDPGDDLEEYVFAAFDEMYAAFERDRALVGPEEMPSGWQRAHRRPFPPGGFQDFRTRSDFIFNSLLM
ncbi:MAG: sulfotransferase [Verrucomicrobiales bacterium]